MRLKIGAAIALVAALLTTQSAEAQYAQPHAATTVTVATGGTAVTAFSGVVNGCYILNPLSAADQGIVTAEVAYIDPVTTATTTGNGTTTTLQPGQPWVCPAPSKLTVSVNAATSGHKLNVVVW